ncbi:hypothetical protein [Streptomyces sp. JB150]|uniref:hypothetical protein n=1 Tax=Streptomyces sp. JB150 TaxID=2714844 RepID=UPI00140B4920|nr:hypothetical protein [Streptomyces sp. JB150]QIJ66286.1 hypothetical protein G7Z13_32965 [Streptomyces sp. JB150]
MSRSQLAPGVEVVAVDGRELAVRTADGEFLRVRTGDADVDALRARLAGADTARADGELDRLVAAFGAAGYLTDADADAEAEAGTDAEAEAGTDVEAGAGTGGPPAAAAAWPAARRDILVLGDPVLTGPLTRLLREAGAEPRPGTPGEAVAPEAAAAVVWCLDGPVPDGLWDDADRLPQHGVAWLRCHREGWQAYLEPVAAAPGDVTSAHLRARRLAATPAHRELAAYWSGPRTTGAPVRLTTPAAALLAALLADDLTRWATDAPDTGALPARRRLRRVDLRTLTVTEHPVLPVPDVARIPVTAR